MTDRNDNPDATASWRVVLLSGLAGASWASGVLLAVVPRLGLSYEPFAGVVGLPLVHDRPARLELGCFAFGLLLAVAVGWGALALARRVRYPSVFALGIAFAGLLSIRLAAIGNTTQGAGLVVQLIRTPHAWWQGALVLAAVTWLGMPRRRIDTVAPPPGIADWLARFGPCCFQFVVVFSALFENLMWAVALALPSAWFGARLLAPVAEARPAGTLVRLERLGWMLWIAVPLMAWYRRLGLTIDVPLPTDAVLIAVPVTLLAVTVVAGSIRHRYKYPPAVGPALFLGSGVFTVMALAAGIRDTYDPFHQGEFIYGAYSQRLGDLPWRDIFYVHGWGINTWMGWLAAAPHAAGHSLDWHVYFLFAATTAGLTCAFLARLWGAVWWPVVIVTGLSCLAAAGPGIARYLPLWLATFAVVRYVNIGRLRWLALAGAASWAGIFYSVDTAAVACVGIGIWTLVWGLGGLSGPTDADTIGSSRASTPMNRWLPAVAFAMGVVAAAIPSMAWLAFNGLFATFWQVHWEYLGMKHHYDKVPLVILSGAFLVSPAIGLMGIWASRTIVRQRQCSPVAALTVLLTLLALLCFMRGLDRADAGHMIYATVPAWVLLGCLVVWRTNATAAGTAPSAPTTRSIHGWTLTRRAGALALAIAVLPCVQPLLTDGHPDRGTTRRLDMMARFYSENRRQPLCLPLVENSASDAFMGLSKQLSSIVGPGNRFYDFSNSPAVYVWAGLRCPTRFYAAFYTATRAWQQEVIDALESSETRWVLWRGPVKYWSAPDGIPSWLRQWWLARHILKNFHPARRLAGNAVLLQHHTTLPTHWPPPADMHPTRSDFSSLPAVLGSRGRTAFPVPSKALHYELSPTLRDLSRPQGVSLEPAMHGVVQQTDELWLTLPVAVRGRCVLRWMGAANEAPREPGRQASPAQILGELAFDLDGEFAGPYRLPISSVPRWVWNHPPAAIGLAIDQPDIDGPVTIQWRYHPSP